MNTTQCCLQSVLTSREKILIDLLSQGFSSKQIAHELNISRNTIENHRKNMLKKTRTKNVAQLVAISIRNAVI